MICSISAGSAPYVAVTDGAEAGIAMPNSCRLASCKMTPGAAGAPRVPGAAGAPGALAAWRAPASSRTTARWLMTGGLAAPSAGAPMETVSVRPASPGGQS
jgi:hypothetical protein